MPRFEDDLRWRNLLRILRTHSFDVEITVATTNEGGQCEGLFVNRPNYPGVELFSGPHRAAKSFLKEIQRHQLLTGFTDEDLDEPDPEASEPEEDGPHDEDDGERTDAEDEM